MIDWSRVKGWVFDLDDTLILERDYVRSGFAALESEVLRRHGVVGFADAAWRHFEAGARGNIFNLALADLGLAADAGAIQALVTAYREHLPRIALMPDASELLDALAGKRPVAILSDGFLPAQTRKVQSLKLRDRADPVVLTDSWGAQYWKPHPRGYAHIQDALGLAPDQLVYVGDNAAKDFQAPRALGWQSVHIRRDGGLHGARAGMTADLVISSFADLPQEARP
jgi:putative hydrolase of the HAD superfamily